MVAVAMSVIILATSCGFGFYVHLCESCNVEKVHFAAGQPNLDECENECCHHSEATEGIQFADKANFSLAAIGNECCKDIHFTLKLTEKFTVPHVDFSSILCISLFLWVKNTPDYNACRVFPSFFVDKKPFSLSGQTLLLLNSVFRI
jgi:hypothetical protein